MLGINIKVPQEETPLGEKGMTQASSKIRIFFQTIAQAEVRKGEKVLVREVLIVGSSGKR